MNSSEQLTGQPSSTIHPDARPSPLATISAVASVVGLVVGHVAGFALGMIAARKIDASDGRLYGYRLALTGWLVGLVGFMLFAFVLPHLWKTQPHDPKFPFNITLLVVLAVEFPIFMLLYGWQDRLPPPRCEFGYRFLGPRGKPAAADTIFLVVGVAGGIGLVAGALAALFGAGHPLRDIFQLTDRALAARVNAGLMYGLIYILISAAVLSRRRGVRALWIFYTVALALGLTAFALWRRLAPS
jgi:hypothetical protein